VVLSASAEPVLLGTAMLAAVAAGAFPSLPDAMAAMSRDREASRPSADLREFHAAKREIQNSMRQLERRARRDMAPWRG
jgi:D-ribulokinase